MEKAMPVAVEHKMKSTVYYHECPECGDPSEEYLESAVGGRMECPLCDTVYTLSKEPQK